MKVLIACEFSGVVRDAFIARGHDAWSCDLLDTESPGPHYKDDIKNVLRFGPKHWDLMIAHPPCTFLTYAGVRYWGNRHSQQDQADAMDLFKFLYGSKIPKICIENPRGLPCREFRKPDQEINPFDFGTPERKRMCLWLKGLPLLNPTNPVVVNPSGSCIKSNGRKYNYYFHQAKNGKSRSVFFPSIAAAMAEQWGSL